MSTEDLRAELAALRAERDSLLAERERTAPLVAAARAYAKASAALARAAKKAFARPDGPTSRTPAYEKWESARDTTIKKEVGLLNAACALHTDGGAK